MSPSSGLKMETVCFSKILVTTDKSMWRHNPEEQHHKIFLGTEENICVSFDEKPFL
jgi:hypothetical protein